MRLPELNNDLAKRIAGNDAQDVREALLAYLVEAGLKIQKELDGERDEVTLRWAQGRKQCVLELAEVLQKAAKQ